MNDKLTQLRRELHREAKDGPGKLALKNSRWLLVKNPHRLDPDRNESQRLEKALALNKVLNPRIGPIHSVMSQRWSSSNVVCRSP